MFRGKSGSWRTGVSLLEVLIVMGIIALLVAILVPSLARARWQTKRTFCMAAAYQLGRSGSRQNIRLQLEALDCGCYGELNKDLGIYTGAFTLPEGMDEKAYRERLEAELLEAK